MEGVDLFSDSFLAIKATRRAENEAHESENDSLP